jgi:hypothetical protein
VFCLEHQLSFLAGKITVLITNQNSSTLSKEKKLSIFLRFKTEEATGHRAENVRPTMHRLRVSGAVRASLIGSAVAIGASHGRRREREQSKRTNRWGSNALNYLLPLHHPI